MKAPLLKVILSLLAAGVAIAGVAVAVTEHQNAKGKK